jgi:single stranded DNA-binding protein
MSNINELQFEGLAGRDAETKEFGNGRLVCNFSLGNSNRNKDGTPGETTWMKVSAFGQWAKVASNIKTGQKVYIKGPIKNKAYTDKQGVKKIDTSVIANIVCLIERNGSKVEQAPPVQRQAPIYDDSQLDEIPF